MLWPGDIHPGVPLPAVLLLALLIDAVIGDPAALYARVPHPVVLIGRAIGFAEARLNRPTLGRAARIALGGLLVAVLVGLAVLGGGAIARGLAALPLGWVAEALVASTLLAGRSLYDHVRAVAAGLEAGLAEGRAMVGRIVGRDPDSLDRAGVARAAIESLAENFSDGVVAPAVWYLVFGLPGLLAYKTVNTLDSMIGHRSERYEAFGKIAARLDDVANLIPARLTGLLLVAAALFVPGAQAGRAWAAMWHDAGRHRSPNAGWPEAAMAGALDLALAGPRRYGPTLVDDPWMGNGRADLDAADIRRALELYCCCMGLLFGCCGGLTVTQIVGSVTGN